MSVVERLNGIKLPVGTEGEREKLMAVAARRLHAPVRYFEITKKSLDARDKKNLHWVYSIAFSAQPQKPVNPLETCGDMPKAAMGKQVVIIGAGPAGLFCAVRLLQWGIRPIVVERGAPIEEREKDVAEFLSTGQLNVDSNIQFGEGGAGTFSDGKLNTQTNNAENADVLQIFVAFGAPLEVLYLQKPHIGSDNLRKVVCNMRSYIEGHGGKVLFHTALTDLECRNGRLVGAVLSDGTKIKTDDMVLAVGHSARDTFFMLERRGIYLQQKEFAVGLRVEHLQTKIGTAQYGDAYRLLPPADYKLVSHVGTRAVFTFCMCPGGYVMPAASEEGQVVTNGMSNYRRDGANANSALVIQIKKEDFPGPEALAGVKYQRNLERTAYVLGGGGYRAPVQRMEDFLARRPSSGAGEVIPSYGRGVHYTDLNALFPGEVSAELAASATDMDRRMKGFAHPDAILTGVESRTSSPVRIVRGGDGQSIGMEGLYPCGEGAGYAGGITSAAADGLRTASRILRKYGAAI